MIILGRMRSSMASSRLKAECVRPGGQYPKHGTSIILTSRRLEQCRDACANMPRCLAMAAAWVVQTDGPQAW